MKLALILNIINPSLGGVLIRGEKARRNPRLSGRWRTFCRNARRSPAADSPAAQKTPIRPADDCSQKIARGESLETLETKMRVVDLPVSATKDRVVGTLDIEQAIKKGEKKFEPGILADANRSILYVDEINLLDDHVVDILLDSAAMGVNFFEREGISYAHPARFTLVGTMNPEEGDLRPQLIDRFGLAVDVVGESSTSQRTEVIRRRLDFESNAEEFKKNWADEQARLASRIIGAAELLPMVKYDDKLLEMAAKISTVFGVDGHRADIVMIKTALTIAAYNNRTSATPEDLRDAAGFVLPHRMRKRLFEDASMSMDSLESLVGEVTT